MSLDLFVFYWINGAHTPWLDKLMPFISDLGNFRLPLWLLGISILYFGKFRERLVVILVLFSVLVGDRLIIDTIKEVVHRPRPFQVLPNVRVVEKSNQIYYSNPSRTEERARGRSFPSGHAANNTAAAVMATAVYGLPAIWLWLWVFMVSYSRIYMGVHYPSDICAGWIISIIYSYTFLYCLHWLWKKYAPLCFPKLYSQYPTLPLNLPFIKKEGKKELS
ncbi:phosphatase PAP2 family protein [Candidatus Methylacidiphilum fumarolicum]|uniref:Membrane-associated phospholipid phosphatase n=2 Tax=Candidatus Methylacidiphilum fumarolicum TaxID=591154 RepID=I0JVZ5_METFB|nr:phosphatase PAP2 family protein [Candidatus Methylacidiphilum fumarolicum]MBW6415548.1 phosphatase PAP2 family protein [Candidatus Methylacidiphilum fumarolicum]TFE68440.1 phospholipid phosphatase [Candidatus Methylacidiphilum fumarolicum]TFE73049.1 phosphatase PAP2 family protein [Candidatus Methylacidiphilum fumarolicum]TFE73106.1 phosphatase PAP2 family protein [Candidatus Methylacidiphilum fumarolicum]TFE77104.1 phospholipid phosphatase [Candidatus Methylacidiphilum fumarolicum]